MPDYNIPIWIQYKKGLNSIIWIEDIEFISLKPGHN